jgi:hypothetical protein
VAAICEFLIQDNTPGYINLLPALPLRLQGTQREWNDDVNILRKMINKQAFI